MTLAAYSRNAVAAFNARHAAADDLLYNSAGFWREGKKWVVAVRDSIVFESSNFKAIESFVIAHNSRFTESAA